MSHSTTTATSTALAPRHHYVDWLRNLAILYLFPFHTSRVFDFFEPYYVEGEESVLATTLIAWSFWFMPLLFVLAGMSSRFALTRRTSREFAVERVRRLLVPLLFGVVVIVPPQAYFGLLTHEGRAPAYGEFLLGYFADWSDLSGYFGSFTPGHLWFIAFLFVSSLVLLPAMSAMTRRGTQVPALRNPAVLIAAPTLLFLGLSALPELGGKNIFWYTGAVFVGFLIAGDEAVMERIERMRLAMLVVAIVGGFSFVIERSTIGWQGGFTPIGIAFSTWHQLVCWAALLAFLGYGRRRLNRPSRVMAYLNEAAFPVYVLHQTVLVAVGFVVLQAVEPMPVQLPLILLGSVVATFGLYEGMRRVPGIAFLLGVKRLSRPRREAAPATDGA